MCVNLRVRARTTGCRLRMQDIPRRPQDRPARMFPAPRHSSADDVHRWLSAISRRVPGGAWWSAATANVQRTCHEFHAWRDSTCHTTLRTRAEGHLQARLAPEHWWVAIALSHIMHEIGSYVRSLSPSSFRRHLKHFFFLTLAHWARSKLIYS